MRITLKAARVNANLKQIEAAKKIGVTKKTIISWEAGKTVPKIDKIPIICEVYNCSYNDIEWTR